MAGNKYNLQMTDGGLEALHRRAQKCLLKDLLEKEIFSLGF